MSLAPGSPLGAGSASQGEGTTSGAPRTLPTHAVPVDLRTTAWVVPDDALPAPGPIAAAPGELGKALAEGTLTRLEVQRGQVLMELAPGLTWRAEGARLRTALLDALAAPGDWRHVDVASRDESLAEVAQRVLAGPTGDYIRSHGGVVEVVSVAGGVVDVRMSGMCAACPLSDFTLHRRVEEEIRLLEPALVSVRRAD